ncbi:MAG: TIGR03620 family F420-dependent LLM class oxidoreductase [Acidimicrobiaceae bacterium]|nr:TIGR03620 family F420-dependent LLM class oxidoreductase [Acidimicrobiaceae bacterium]
MNLNQLAKTGVWHFTDGMSAQESGAFAARVESLGYSALWVPDAIGRDPFVNCATLLNATTDLIVATGIANIWVRHPNAMVQGALSLAELSDDRFLLGIGVSHQPSVEGVQGIPFGKPLATMTAYLETMSKAEWRGPKTDMPPVVIAALGPKMLELARTASAGAHPYWTTPEHTAGAAAVLGPDALLCVEQKVCLTTDPEIGRAKGAEQLAIYSRLPNYRNSWKRMGFTEEQIATNDPVFVDAVFAWGDVATLQARVDAHYTAGATHVCIQPVHPTAERGTVDWDVLEALAPN